MQHPKIALTLVAAAVALVGCGEQKPAAKAPAAPAAMEVKIGHVGPITGGIAHLGKDNENGARLAVEQANEAKIQLGGKDVRFVF
ncbi:MAG TPA: branched-chain amino acid ABC transporter substrate-binding protein, partial [Burkholderiales bacterium]|nr:branched-chain amino acid ABC transporter substrate-binding protein [Burkholderiales bacterium]